MSHKRETKLECSDEEKKSSKELVKIAKKHSSDKKHSERSEDVKKCSKDDKRFAITLEKACSFQEAKSAFMYVKDFNNEDSECTTLIPLKNISPPPNNVNNTFATFSPNDYDIFSPDGSPQYRPPQRFTLTTTSALPFPIQSLVTVGKPSKVNVSINSLSNIFPIGKSSEKTIDLIFTYDPGFVLVESGSFSIYGSTGVLGALYAGSISVTYHTRI